MTIFYFEYQILDQSLIFKTVFELFYKKSYNTKPNTVTRIEMK